MIPNATDRVSEKTCERWMKFLGFTATKASKGWFTDGHERIDVVQSRGQFLSIMEPLQRRMRSWSGKKMEIEKLPTLEAGEREAVLITHDESTFYCHEGLKIFWLENGKKKILPKSRGLSIMVSGFLCACHGVIEGHIDIIIFNRMKVSK